MEDLCFRPRVEGLEDRFVPTVTPVQVNAALVHTMFVADELQGVREKLPEAHTAQTISFLATHLRERSQESVVAAGVLDEFRLGLLTQMAENPSLAPAISRIIGGIGAMEAQAVYDAAFAEVLARGFGAPAPSPPPPPPFSATPANFGSSQLPFSLTDPSFQTLSSGVRIMDVAQGTGATVQVGDKFTAKYAGYLTDGTVFDSSDKSGQLSTTLDNQHLIQGFVNGVAGMQVGGTRRIDIPANLGYGAAGTTGVPPNSELVFEVTLVSSP